MKINILQWSLKTRITLFTLAIFVLSIWSLSFYASNMLRTDMEHMLSEQQLSTVSLVAADINEEFENRFKYLHAIAASISPAMLRNTAELQSFLEQKKILGIMFNAGAFITRTDGTAIASTPLSGERIGVSYMDRDHIIAVLKEGKATIGLPVIGKKLHSPLIPMGVPIRDAKGNVIGSLTGATNLGMSNFLNKITESRYGKSGGYVLLVPQHRLIVTASDQSRIMQSLPAPGVVPTLDRFLDGYEGSAVYINPLGVQVLGSAKKIPAANWLMGVTLPITEAFAPIHEMQQRVILVALFLTLLAGGLTWWMLRRQLSPMFSAVKTLGSLSNNMQSTQLLPITRQDEIGTLIGSFNHLLQTLMQREQALITSTARLNEAQHIAQIGNWTLNLPDGELIWSDEIFRIFEIDPTRFDATYEAFLNTIHPDDRDAVNQAYSDSLATRKPYEITHRLLMSDGRIKWVQEKCTSDFDAAGKPLQSRGMVQDITAAKLTELALIAARDEAERANRAKSEFLSSMSHELRTPMNAILGFSQLMRYDNNFPDVHKGNVSEILNAGHHLLELINELLDLSQIESGHFNLLMEPVEVCSVIDECLSLLGVMADKRNIHLSHIGLKGAMVLADRTRLKQVLLNLLSNAIKYNREGGSVRIEILQHDTNRLRLVVTDTGPGIPAARLAELFQPFNRLGAENSNILGTGIGLTITRRIVEAMGGSVDVESEVGIGSTFWIELPLEFIPVQTQAQPLPHTGPAAPQHLEPAQFCVLYIEDNPSNLRLVAKLLGPRKHIRLITAHTPELGIELAKVHHPDLILLDINMPNMDGYQLLKFFKESSPLKNIPVIAITANAMPREIERGMAAGFTAYLTKPLDISHFYSVIDRILQNIPADKR